MIVNNMITYSVTFHHDSGTEAEGISHCLQTKQLEAHFDIFLTGPSASKSLQCFYLTSVAF